MAKLKNPPFTLNAIIGLIVVTIFLSIIMLFVAFAGKGGNGFDWEALVYCIGMLFFSCIISGFYYIVKAACLIIEKEESTKETI